MLSNRIQLVCCNVPLIEALLKGSEELAKYLGITIPSQWTEFGETIFEYSLQQIIAYPNTEKWWSYLPILVSEKMLIGSCGYKGAPNEEGMVEIGYEVAKDYRRQGFATEIAKMLITQAFEDKTVQKIQAHTLAEESPSTRILHKCGFKMTGAFEDEEDGHIWRWELLRERN